MSWEDQANCKGLTHLFFDEHDDGHRDYRNLALIKDLCNRCPVQDRCLDMSLLKDNVGFWAGTDKTGRAILRAEKKKECSTMDEPWGLLSVVFSTADEIQGYDLLLDSVYG